MRCAGLASPTVVRAGRELNPRSDGRHYSVRTIRGVNEKMLAVLVGPEEGETPAARPLSSIDDAGESFCNAFHN
jgi:hypothetical protein